MSIRNLLLLMLLCLVSTNVKAQDKQKLDAYFSALAAENKFMGQVTMYKDGKTIYSKSIGITEQSKSPIHENTKFRIGSVTKTFTAALIMKAADENRLQLNDHLLKYFPQVTNADKITIAQLLAHRSGIHNFTDDAAYQVWQTLAKSDAEMIDIIVKGGSDVEPGT